MEVKFCNTTFWCWRDTFRWISTSQIVMKVICLTLYKPICTKILGCIQNTNCGCPDPSTLCTKCNVFHTVLQSPGIWLDYFLAEGEEEVRCWVHRQGTLWADRFPQCTGGWVSQSVAWLHTTWWTLILPWMHYECLKITCTPPSTPTTAYSLNSNNFF